MPTCQLTQFFYTIRQLLFSAFCLCIWPCLGILLYIYPRKLTFGPLIGFGLCLFAWIFWISSILPTPGVYLCTWHCLFWTSHSLLTLLTLFICLQPWLYTWSLGSPPFPFPPVYITRALSPKPLYQSTKKTQTSLPLSLLTNPAFSLFHNIILDLSGILVFMHLSRFLWTITHKLDHNMFFCFFFLESRIRSGILLFIYYLYNIKQWTSAHGVKWKTTFKTSKV